MSVLDRAKARVDRRLGGLIPDVRGATLQAIALLADQGLGVRIVFGLRTFEEQYALYLQGRQEVTTINAARAKVGFPLLSPTEAARKVTNARPGRSWHNWGRAVDVVPVDPATEADLSDIDLPLWTSPHWAAVAEAFKLQGFEWGGDWTHPDKPHFQMTGGNTFDDLLVLHPKGLGG